MSDNTTLNVGSGGDTFKSDDIGDYKVAASKIVTGADGVDGGYVTVLNPFPITFVQADGTIMPAEPTFALGDTRTTTLDRGLIGVVRQDTPAALSGVTDGTYTTHTVDALGRLWCNVNNTVTVDGSGVTQPVSLASVPSHNVTNAGTFAVQATQAGTWNIGTVTTVSAVTAITNALPAGTNTIGDVGLAPRTSGGLTPYKLICAASTNATSVKASAGQVYAYEAFNNNASSWRYLKLYDKASAPTVGTDTPVKVIGIPPAGGANFAFPQGVAFSLGIAFAVTTGIADTDTGAVSASEVAVNLDYK